ncbi:hypothetical protein [Vreelandella sp. EE7]
MGNFHCDRRQPKHAYKKASVMMLDLTDQHGQQLSLMNTPQTDENRQRSQQLMANMDALDEKIGKGRCGWGYRRRTRLGTCAVLIAVRSIRRTGMS